MGCSLLRREQFLAARELALASYHEVRNPLSGGTHHLRQLQEDLMTFGRGNERSSDTLAARRARASVDTALWFSDPFRRERSGSSTIREVANRVEGGGSTRVLEIEASSWDCQRRDI